MGKYVVIKTLAGRPNEGNRGSSPEREVVMSRHRTLELAVRAERRYEREHRGYAHFRIDYTDDFSL